MTTPMVVADLDVALPPPLRVRQPSVEREFRSAAEKQQDAMLQAIACVNGAAGPQQKKAVFQLSTSLQTIASGMIAGRAKKKRVSLCTF